MGLLQSKTAKEQRRSKGEEREPREERTEEKENESNCLLVKLYDMNGQMAQS